MADKRIDIKSVIIAPKAEWQGNDPVMSKGLLLMEEGTTCTKLADGEHKWSELKYFTCGEDGYVITADISALEEATKKLREDLTALGNDVDAINNELGDKADDDMVVHRKGISAETVEGNKAFSGTCVSRSSDIPENKSDELITVGYLDTAHNQSATAHSDIRTLITTLQNDLSKIIVSGGVDQYGVEADYAIHYGILDCPNGLIEHTQNNKQITLQPGIVLQAAGNSLRTTIASELKYTVKETGKIVLFYAEGSILEAGAVYYQEAEPTNGDVGYLAWYKPSLGKWQFKSDDTGNVFREAVATPIANVNAGEDGIVSINYVGYRIVDDDCPAQMSDVEAIEDKITTINGSITTLTDDVAGLKTTVGGHTTTIDTLNTDVSGLKSTVAGHTTSIGSLDTTVKGHTASINSMKTTLDIVSANALFTTTAATIADVAADADAAAIVTALNGLLSELRTRGIIA